MSHDKVIDALLRDLAELRADFDALTRTSLRQAGENQVYRKTLLALVAGDGLAALSDELRRDEAQFVHECMSEDCMEGAQAAQRLVLLAIEESGRKAGIA
ncbi:hypothetical protein [Noviherbaspirillum aridicola]|uniref:Uncharacterized protein n=1 Tax=Noviherbaspirillum aridicola TaxID=2849687 RepID=A0ABQ4QAY1_9BURK|nr:hypothetical protein [Noviherbaspirillum aridicola]GIZ54052.1 hypothetical protein NCCP691_40660 [Noviherbaspirillum aridicola]